MRLWLSLLVVVAACQTADGTRGQCGEGGTLEQCPESERTAEGACWRLVNCAAIPLKSDDQNRFDWDNCVRTIDTYTSDRERLVIDCIAASSCDSLKVNGSPDDPDTNSMACLALGDQ